MLLASVGALSSSIRARCQLKILQRMQRKCNTSSDTLTTLRSMEVVLVVSMSVFHDYPLQRPGSVQQHNFLSITFRQNTLNSLQESLLHQRSPSERDHRFCSTTFSVRGKGTRNLCNHVPRPHGIAGPGPSVQRQKIKSSRTVSGGLLWGTGKRAGCSS